MRQRSSYDVLVVEDNKENQDVLRIGLGSSSVNVAVADDGAAAINAINAAVYDAILLDLELPCVNGMATIRISGFPSSSARFTIVAPATQGEPDEARKLPSQFTGLAGHGARRWDCACAVRQGQ